jgi:acetoin utilization protein AcuB
MTVSMWMTREVVTIGPDAPASEAAAVMIRKRIRWLLVVEGGTNQGRLRGLVSAEDVLHAFPPEVNPFSVEGPDARQTQLTAGEIMKKNAWTTTPETPVEEAAAAMNEQKVGALPVLRGAKIVGIITEADIFRAFSSLFSAEGRGARITFDASKSEDVFEVIGKFARRDGVHVVSLIQTLQDKQPVYVVRVMGEGVDPLVDDLWRSGHLVLSVLRFG